MYYRRSSFGGAIPPGIKNLLFANGIIFIVGFLNVSLNQTIFNLFALTPIEVLTSFKIWQLVTYLFLHGGFIHIFFNMFMLWMFGMELEYEWGTKEFIKYYLICGIGAGLFVMLFTPYARTIGASGAVYGVMLAFALKNPNREIFIIPIPVPIKVKYAVGFFVLISFFSTIGATSDGIAHAAHLGGAAIGYAYLKFWKQGYKIRNIFSSLRNYSSKKPDMTYTRGDKQKLEFYRSKIDELLDKINRVGYLNLTEEEKELLEEGSKYLREHDSQSDIH